MVLDIIGGFILGVIATVCIIDSIKNEMTYRKVKEIVDIISLKYKEERDERERRERERERERECERNVDNNERKDDRHEVRSVSEQSQ